MQAAFHVVGPSMQAGCGWPVKAAVDEPVVDHVGAVWAPGVGDAHVAFGGDLFGGCGVAAVVRGPCGGALFGGEEVGSPAPIPPS